MCVCMFEYFLMCIHVYVCAYLSLTHYCNPSRDSIYAREKAIRRKKALDMLNSRDVCCLPLFSQIRPCFLPWLKI